MLIDLYIILILLTKKFFIWYNITRYYRKARYEIIIYHIKD